MSPNGDHRILIAYATRHGSTKEIAERLEATFQAGGARAYALPVAGIVDADGYDGYVIGSAVYAMHWLGEAKSFVNRNRTILRRHPVWLFSSGPLSTDPAEAGEAAPRDVPAMKREIEARSHRVFPGAWQREAPPIGVMEKVMSLFPAAREALPDGDFRDWDAIDQFAREILAELELALQTA